MRLSCSKASTERLFFQILRSQPALIRSTVKDHHNSNHRLALVCNEQAAAPLFDLWLVIIEIAWIGRNAKRKLRARWLPLQELFCWLPPNSLSGSLCNLTFQWWL